MALSSGNWTVAFLNGDRSIDTEYGSRKKYVHLKLTMASGQWPSAGVALPGAGSVGLVRNLDGYILNHVPAATTSAQIWIATTGKKLQVRKSVLVSGANGQSIQAATGTLNSKIFIMTAVGW